MADRVDILLYDSYEFKMNTEKSKCQRQKKNSLSNYKTVDTQIKFYLE